MAFRRLEVWGHPGFNTGVVCTDGLRSILKAHDEDNQPCTIVRWENGQYVVARGTPLDVAAALLDPPKSFIVRDDGTLEQAS